MNDASRATGVPASQDRSPLEGTGVVTEVRSVATRQLRLKSPNTAPVPLRKLVHPQREGQGDRGRRPTDWVGAQASRLPSTADSESGLSICGHRVTAGPQTPACFDRDVTSDFFFRFLAKRRSASLQPGGLPVFFHRRWSVFIAGVLQRLGHFRRPSWVTRATPVWPSDQVSSPPIAPPSWPAPATLGVRKSRGLTPLRHFCATGLTVQVLAALWQVRVIFRK